MKCAACGYSDVRDKHFKHYHCIERNMPLYGSKPFIETNSGNSFLGCEWWVPKGIRLPDLRHD